jgi:prepilin-type N-terminal cleavage/methylation domain-containing protein
MRRPAQRMLRHAGFTLVEVLVTIALAATILPVAMKGISLATNLASQAKRQAEAATLAEMKLAEVVATSSWQTGEVEGDFSPEWPDYRWSVELSDWQDPAMQEITVNVTWTQRGTQREVSVTTLTYTGSPQSASTSTSN